MLTITTMAFRALLLAAAVAAASGFCASPLRHAPTCVPAPLRSEPVAMKKKWERRAVRGQP